MEPDTPSTRAFTCPHCKAVADGRLCGTATSSGLRSTRGPYEPAAEWVLIQCPRCEWPSVQVREDFGRGFGDDEPSIYYPRPRRLSGTVPEALRLDWDEARVCLDAKAHRATVVMVRRLLEGVAEMHGVTEGKLHDRLTKMSATGLLDPTLAEWAQALRLLGNKGAHSQAEPISRQDAEDALDFAEALLDHVFVLRRRFEDFKARNTRDTDDGGPGS